MDILSPFQDHRLETEGKEFESGEKASRTSANDDDRFRIGNVPVLRHLIRNI